MNFYTSDLHFSHKNICAYTGRPFDNVEEMNEGVVSNWNAVVDPSDRVYIVGDVAMGKVVDTLPTVTRLNGYKILILGNHDRPFAGNSEKQKLQYGQLYQSLFDEIHDSLEIEIAGVSVLLNHFPAHQVSRDADRHNLDQLLPYYVNAATLGPDRWLIHGHTHQPEARTGPYSLHVGWDADWTPVGVERYHPVPEEVIAMVIQA